MPTYSFIVNTASFPMRTTVHSESCRCVSAARTRREPVAQVDAETAAIAAAIYSEKNQMAERGLRQPEICKCAE